MSGTFAALILGFAGGCAVNPLSSTSSAQYDAVAERDLLADAARAVEAAPWPKPETVSFVSRLTGAAPKDRVTKNDAAEVYVSVLGPAGERFSALETDAMANLEAAARLRGIADNALFAPRLTSSDVALVEDAIQALRENRQIYVSAAHRIEKLGETVDDDRLDAIRDSYAAAISELGETADALADRLDRDNSENYASPAKSRAHNLSGV